MKHSNYSDRQIMDILNQATAGVAIPDLCHEHGISRATFSPNMAAWMPR